MDISPLFTILTLALLSNLPKLPINALVINEINLLKPLQINLIGFLNIHYCSCIIRFKACVHYFLFLHQLIALQKL